VHNPGAPTAAYAPAAGVPSTRDTGTPPQPIGVVGEDEHDRAQAGGAGGPRQPPLGAPLLLAQPSSLPLPAGPGEPCPPGPRKGRGCQSTGRQAAGASQLDPHGGVHNKKGAAVAVLLSVDEPGTAPLSGSASSSCTQALITVLEKDFRQDPHSTPAVALEGVVLHNRSHVGKERPSSNPPCRSSPSTCPFSAPGSVFPGYVATVLVGESGVVLPRGQECGRVVAPAPKAEAQVPLLPPGPRLGGSRAPLDPAEGGSAMGPPPALCGAEPPPPDPPPQPPPSRPAQPHAVEHLLDCVTSQ
jgi:hypothetical protein